MCTVVIDNGAWDPQGNSAINNRRNRRLKHGTNDQRTLNAKAASEGRVVYVRGIPADWSVAHLEDLFGNMHTLESVNLLPQREGQRARAAFVNFTTCNAAEQAVAAYDQLQVQNAKGEDVFWLGCSLKASLNTKVEIATHNTNVPSAIIDDFLFLGNLDNARKECTVKEFGIQYLLSILSDDEEDPEITYHGHQRLLLKAQDTEGEDISKLFGPACQFLQKVHAKNARVLVHCVAGRSRSASVVLAFLMRHWRMALSDAFAYVKEKRPCVLPSDSFWRQLEAEELKLFGIASPVPIQYLRLHSSPALSCADATSISSARVPPSSRSTCSSKENARRNCELVVHLSPGNLSAAHAQVIADLRGDLQQLSARFGVEAYGCIQEDKVSMSCTACCESPSASRLELQKILQFFGFRDIHWDATRWRPDQHVVPQASQHGVRQW